LRRIVVAALRNAPFGRLLATYTLDEAADWLLGIALAVFVWERTGNALAVAGILIASRFGPSLVITPLSQRLSTVRLGAALAGLYVAAGVIAAVVAAATGAPLPVLYLLTFAATTCAATGRVLTRTAACNTLDRHGLLREGAAALNVSYGAVNVLGPAAAGAATVLAGTQVGVLCAAAVFLALAAATWTLDGTVAGGDTAADDDAKPVGLREALRVLTSSPGVAGMLAAATVLLVLFCMDEPILLPYVEQALGGTTTQFATLLTFWGVGLLLGGISFTLLRRWSMLGTFVVAGTLLAGSYLTLGASHGLAVAYAAAVLGGIGNGMFWATLTVVTLEAVPPAMRAQTSGLVESLALATPGIGYLLGGGLSEVLSPAEVYLLAGALGGAVVLALGLALWRPARRLTVTAPAFTAIPSEGR
jgi:hypothetical protein